MQGKRIKIFLKIIFIIAIFILINYTNGNSRKVTIFENVVTNLISLPQRFIVNAKNYTSENNEYFSNVERLKKENEELTQELKEINEKLLGYESLQAENELLKKHIKLANLYADYSIVVADIITAATSNWEYTYTLNRGSKDGIEPNMAVIAESGLVGYIESVTSNTAKVVSILDAGNAVSARVTRTRDTVISKGSLSLAEKRQMRITNIPIGVSLIEGDKIETSGLGGIYPKGILIGKVRSFEQKSNPVENEAIIESYVDFDKLETVAVICVSQD